MTEERAFKTELFPLELTPFELYHFYDNVDEFPALFTTKLVWRGACARDVWQTALDRALDLHPLLAANVVQERGRFYWTPCLKPTITWFESEEALDSAPIQKIELDREPGLKIFATTRDDAVFIRVFTHHATCDGGGFIAFLSDWFLETRRLIGGNAAPCAQRNLDYLSRRDKFVFPPPPKQFSAFHNLASSVYYSAQWLIQRPKALVGDFTQARFDGVRRRFSDKPGEQRVAFRVLDPETASALRKRCKERDETFLSFWLAVFFTRLNRFYGAKRALYRITLPFNLRRPEDADATACNALSYCFSTRRARDLGDSLALSRNIAAEIQMFRDWSSAAFFISSLGSFARVPGLLRATINLPRVLSSAVFSSLGDCGRLFDARLPRDENGRIAFGELTLDKIYFSGPCRRGSNIFISAYSYGGEFYLSYRYASRFVQLDETFLDLWREL
ncbi:MAG: hypothetical protein IJU03_07585 [Thermoguttaceae bacterium]|nr:hypothetical protein [Thermoguttaceae bacterium]